jgi:hypothetical protein
MRRDLGSLIEIYDGSSVPLGLSGTLRRLVRLEHADVVLRLLLRRDLLREAPVLNKLSFGLSRTHDVLLIHTVFLNCGFKD